MDEARRGQIVRDLLEKCDQDHDGKLIDRKEIQNAYFFLGKTYLKQFDTNQNGRIDGEEFTGIREFIRPLRPQDSQGPSGPQDNHGPRSSRGPREGNRP
jgi:hypothetical protein